MLITREFTTVRKIITHIRTAYDKRFDHHFVMPVPPDSQELEISALADDQETPLFSLLLGTGTPLSPIKGAPSLKFSGSIQKDRWTVALVHTETEVLPTRIGENGVSSSMANHRMVVDKYILTPDGNKHFSTAEMLEYAHQAAADRRLHPMEREWAEKELDRFKTTYAHLLEPHAVGHLRRHDYGSGGPPLQ